MWDMFFGETSRENVICRWSKNLNVQPVERGHDQKNLLLPVHPTTQTQCYSSCIWKEIFQLTVFERDFHCFEKWTINHNRSTFASLSKSAYGTNRNLKNHWKSFLFFSLWRFQHSYEWRYGKVTGILNNVLK